MTRDSGTPAVKQPRPSIADLIGNVVPLARAHRFKVSVFRNHYARQKPSESMETLASLARTIEGEVGVGKWPSLKLATYGDKRTPRRKGGKGGNSLRSQANTIASWGVEIDSEDKPSAGMRSQTLEEIERRIRDAGLSGLCYPTKSHGRDGETHARIVLPYARPIGDWDEHTRMIARAAGVLGGLIDPVSFTPSQPMYFGAPVAPRVTIVEGGRWLDAADDLDAGALGRADVYRIQRGEAPTHRGKPPTQAVRREHAPYFNGDLDALREALMTIPNTDPPFNWEQWTYVLFAVHFEAGEDGREIAEDWSATSDKHTEEEFDGVWGRIRGGGERQITGEFIADHAREHGWIPPWWFDDLGPEDASDDKPKKPHPLSIAGMNRKHAAVFLKGSTIVAYFETDRMEFGCKQALHDWYANKKVTVKDGEKEKEKEVVASVLWWASPARKEYRGVVFDPTGGDTAALNLWQGWGVEPKPEASCDLILKHIRDVVCNGRPDLFDYCVKYDAHMVQHPGMKPGVCRVLRGKEGVGKDSYGRLLSRIVGKRHTTHIGDGTRLTERFNSAYEAAMFVWAEEACFAGDKRERGKLYHLITSADVRIERKGVESFGVDSYLRLLMSSNEGWVVWAGADARRFVLIDVAQTYLGRGPTAAAYFDALHAEIDGDGPAAYRAYLEKVDLTGWDVRAIPHTTALDDQKRHSAPPMEKWWEGCLHSGQFWEERLENGLTQKDTVYGAYCRCVRELRFGGDPLGPVLFWKSFRDMCPYTDAPRGSRKEGRPLQIQLPRQSTCQAAFERHMGISTSTDSLIG